MIMTSEQLTNYGWRRDPNMEDLNETLTMFGITTPARIAHFISQCAHESGLGSFTKELASGEAYETRQDLGNTPAYDGDGPRYKGAGYIQLTGRNNYQRFANYIGDPDVMQGVDYVAERYPWRSAGFWWLNNGMNELVDSGATVEQITYRVNGGDTGLQDREALYDRWLQQNPETEDDTMKFENDWQWKQLGDALDGLYKKGLITDYTWAEKAYNRNLTQSDLSWLNTVVFARQNGVEV